MPVRRTAVRCLQVHVGALLGSMAAMLTQGCKCDMCLCIVLIGRMLRFGAHQRHVLCFTALRYQSMPTLHRQSCKRNPCQSVQ